MARIQRYWHAHRHQLPDRWLTPFQRPQVTAINKPHIHNSFREGQH